MFASSTLTPSTADVLRAIAAAEAQLHDALSSQTLAPHALDQLSCHAATAQREGGFFRPVVIVMVDDRPVIMSADTARRLAIRQSSQRRQGAALDLMECADLAEELAAKLQRSFH
jgi:uncharacterized protein YegL